MLPQGTTRVTAAVNNYEAKVTEEGDSRSFGNDALEAMVSHGVGDGIEVGGKLAFIDAQANIFHFMVVPKISLVPDKLALVAPTGAAYVGEADIDGDGNPDGESGHFFETLPGLVFSHLINEYFEFTGAGQLIWLVNEDFDDSEFYIGANVGIKFRPPGAAWAVQPEIGLSTPLTNRDESMDYTLQYGIAVHYDFGGAAVAAGPVAGPPPP